MKVADLRKRLDLSQEAFASLLGLNSKSYVCDLEKTGRCSARIALEIERLSEGKIPAESLNPDVALVRQADAQ
jgi:DNA-binding transcriptional regulator YdaS (Cro superfamily)